MFNFNIYNSWIKKQIYIPLKQILDLLQKNLDKLNENKDNIVQEIKKTTDESFAGPLVASKTRTEMKIEDIKKHIK
jgi:cell division protein FtsB